MKKSSKKLSKKSKIDQKKIVDTEYKKLKTNKKRQGRRNQKILIHTTDAVLISDLILNPLLQNPIERDYKVNTVEYIKFYNILFDIDDGAIRMRLYRRALNGLNIKDSAITQHLLVTKQQLLNAIKFNLIHPDERFLRNKILKVPDTILYDVGIPNDGWSRN